MRILLTVIFGSALLFSCTKNKGLAACKQFEKDFTFGFMDQVSTPNGQTTPTSCLRAKTARTHGGVNLTENTLCKPTYMACVAMGKTNASADDKMIVFLYNEAGKNQVKGMWCDQNDVDCDWYQD